jgi:hypothetical protein
VRQGRGLLRCGGTTNTDKPGKEISRKKDKISGGTMWRTSCSSADRLSTFLAELAGGRLGIVCAPLPFHLKAKIDDDIVNSLPPRLRRTASLFIWHVWSAHTLCSLNAGQTARLSSISMLPRLGQPVTTFHCSKLGATVSAAGRLT